MLGLFTGFQSTSKNNYLEAKGNPPVLIGEMITSERIGIWIQVSNVWLFILKR